MIKTGIGQGLCGFGCGLCSYVLFSFFCLKMKGVGVRLGRRYEVNGEGEM